MGPRTASLSLVLCALVAGCGSSDEAPATPAVCLDGPEAYVDALRAAPAEVALDGTPIGDCLTEEQASGAFAEVGGAMIGAARTLNEEAREEPLGDPPVQLGYLVGAVEARAEETGRHPSGPGAELGVRGDVRARATSCLPGGFQQRYEEGLAAGRDSG